MKLKNAVSNLTPFIVGAFLGWYLMDKIFEIYSAHREHQIKTVEEKVEQYLALNDEQRSARVLLRFLRSDEIDEYIIYPSRKLTNLIYDSAAKGRYQLSTIGTSDVNLRELVVRRDQIVVERLLRRFAKDLSTGMQWHEVSKRFRKFFKRDHMLLSDPDEPIWKDSPDLKRTGAYSFKIREILGVGNFSTEERARVEKDLKYLERKVGVLPP